MGWFEDQIRERRESDRSSLEDSFRKIAQVVLGQRMADILGDRQFVTKQALDEVLRYYHFKPLEVPEKIKTIEERMDYCLRHYGMMCRDIELSEGWYKDAYGPILGFTSENGTPVALLPGKFFGYYYHDPETGEQVRINRKREKYFKKEAICFYRPMPMHELSIPELMLYMKSCVELSDIMLVILAAFMVSAVGLLLPKITAAVTGPVLDSGMGSALIGAGIFIFCILLSQQLIGSLRNLLYGRLQTKISLGVESSMMMRVLSLPVSFFRQYSPGDLKTRCGYVTELCDFLQGLVMDSGLTALSSLLYVSQILRFAPALVIPSLVAIILTVGFSLFTTYMQVGINRLQRQLRTKESGMSYSMITGVQKIKLAGAEKRAFAKWLSLYAGEVQLQYNPPSLLKISGVITKGISLFTTIILYFMAVESGVTPSAYYAFTAAYGTVMGAFTALTGIAASAAQIRPILELIQPFLKTVPETAEDKEVVTGISGSVELSHVSFRYSDQTPYIINDLSLTIRPGEYVGIVGRTGCGKSTLIRLLLGFETPEKGAVYYDGNDLALLDASSLRRNIGTVLQDGRLFQGDIYSNITITAPHLTVDEAWAAAEKAGIADDIRAMPMGMNTIISEGQSGISGGQRQRLMIARAIAPGPKLLIFDEATSALDNVTQKHVAEALDEMGCTRIVVAHRLSSILHCDRILVLEGGTIIENGTYEELIEKGGFFASLVERQRLETRKEE